jgi:hypothetical protein
MSEKTLRDYHNEGEKDASNGKSSLPHDAVEEILSFFNPFSSSFHFHKIESENEAYIKGQDNYNASLHLREPRQ